LSCAKIYNDKNIKREYKYSNVINKKYLINIHNLNIIAQML